MLELHFKLKRDNFDVIIDEHFGSGITGIYGQSGSGKSSLLNAICGLASPYEGEISINGKTVFSSRKGINIPVQKRKIGYVFQEGRLFPHMTVEQNLRYGEKKHSELPIAYDELIDLLKIRHILQSKPSSISGGERQRTAIGRALLSSPEILLLDEPFSAVDTQLKDQLLPYLFSIHKAVNIPMLVVSHDISDLLKLTNRLCIIKQGRCIANADYHQLLLHREFQEFFRSDSLINAIDMQVSKTNEKSGITKLTNKQNTGTIHLVCEKTRTQYKEGELVKLFIRSDDIAIAKNRIEEITIQNQIPGTVSNIIPRGNRSICVIDCGFPLLVEVTSASLDKLSIGESSEVWCMFKSVAIDVAG